MRIDIRSIDDIDDVSGLLHDATITFDEIEFQEMAGLFSAIFNRHMWEEVKRRGLFRRMKIQAVHSKLTFENVKSMEIDSDNKLYPTNEVNCIEANGSNVNILFHNDVIIKLVLQKYKGSLEDLNQPWDINGPVSLSLRKD